MKINILGTEYDYEGATHDTDGKLHDCTGYADFTNKIIRFETNGEEIHPNSNGNWALAVRKVKRHEIVHSYLYESGLNELAHNEQIVDWIALQFPKMLKSFQETDCI